MAVLNSFYSLHKYKWLHKVESNAESGATDSGLWQLHNPTEIIFLDKIFMEEENSNIMITWLRLYLSDY